jgi:hypothetical protein
MEKQESLSKYTVTNIPRKVHDSYPVMQNFAGDCEDSFVSMCSHGRVVLGGPQGFGRKNFKIRTQDTDGPNYCYAVYTFPVGYKSLVASCITPDKIKGEDPFVRLCRRHDATGSR